MILTFHKINMKKGFTLIELLIVIGILGILAAGLLAAIDPLEQLKRGRDTTRKNVAVETVNAVTRYYSVYGTMPWGNAALAAAGISAGTVTPVIGALTTAGELKTTFQQGLGAALTTGAYALTVAGGANGEGFVVCFDPESRAASRDAGTMFSAAAVPLVITANPGNSDTGRIWCTN